jgi:uncharacterized repeat protein (TIGR04076 family)
MRYGNGRCRATIVRACDSASRIAVSARWSAATGWGTRSTFGARTVLADSTFSMYALAALLPLLPAKQRETNPNDWMTTDADIACPDPNCGARFRITRTGRRTFRHQDVTAVPLPPRDSR